MSTEILENKEIKNVELSKKNINGEIFFKISNSNQMRPFFMSIVSDSNHWMFISSNGGLSAGRKDSNNAIFPYYTDDKITESADVTGSKSIFRVYTAQGIQTWEPFSIRNQGKYNSTQNLYKNRYGNKVMFEEINHDLKLTYRYQWNSSNTYGFIRKSQLINHNDTEIKVEILDGIQNVLPYGISSDFQAIRSNLGDAYKRSELQKETGLGIYALSAIIVDRAEPSEALKANIVWSLGIENPKYLLSSLQLDDFRKGDEISEEYDIKAEKGAYFINAELTLKSKEEKEWMLIADVNHDHTQIAHVAQKIKTRKNLYEDVNERIERGTTRLIALNASSDGIQKTADHLRDTRHFANTLFNVMRGGIFDENYKIEKWDFDKYLSKANKEVYANNKASLNKLGDQFTFTELNELSYQSGDKDFERLSLEYMPLRFSRRHGDPSRPWNKFSINTKSEIDGSKILDYEGNWRDIFQNWEALAHAFPDFIESMIVKFLNASTFDGYNPYRVTKDGFDWEVIEEHDPWSYIGYWGDHQIIYLLKFLEFIENHQPKKLESYFSEHIFVYANVPYKIRNYQKTLEDPKETIDFDYDLDEKIRTRRDKIGADGALLQNANQEIIKVNFIEKILATTLAKVSNFIPEGGIWMNTQRPEWNDANNALVGNGVSMVTLYYLRRFLKFFNELLANTRFRSTDISEELHDFFVSVHQTLEENKEKLNGKISDSDRKTILDGLGEAGSTYRETIYNQSFSGNVADLEFGKFRQFIKTTLAYLDHSIEANKREDNLYHAYNLMTVESETEVSISYLSEMLEGQVAVLSSGYLNAEETLKALDAMKTSKLFRHDQYSYLLYPNKELPNFLERNKVPKEAVEQSELMKTLIADENGQIIKQDVFGDYHFNGNFNNANILKEALSELDEKYSELVKKDKNHLLATYEQVFNHKAFTGRSGTFYGYEGLGSIYWHMVSKLQLAVQECCLAAIENGENAETVGRLLEHYYEINEGIGVHKPPTLYGAFPTDPYSHTPGGKGAQQPGMTGQVKEDILSRIGELGVFVKDGHLIFYPCLLRKNEFISEPNTYNYVDVNQEPKKIDLDANSLAFSYCQVPVIYKIAEKDKIEITYADGKTSTFDETRLDLETSSQVFKRKGVIDKIVVFVNQTILK